MCVVLLNLVCDAQWMDGLYLGAVSLVKRAGQRETRDGPSSTSLLGCRFGDHFLGI
jgi:hypothetical protein